LNSKKKRSSKKFSKDYEAQGLNLLKKRKQGTSRKFTSVSKEKASLQFSSQANLAVIATKDLVAFPSVMMALYVAKLSVLNAVEQALKSDRLLFIVLQKNGVEDPEIKDLHKVGVIAHIVRTLKLADGRVKVLFQGTSRAKVLLYQKGKDLLTAKVKELHDTTIQTINKRNIPLKKEEADKKRKHEKQILKRIKDNLQTLVEKEHLPEEMLIITEESSSPGILADIILAHYRLEPQQSQTVLEELDPMKRLELTDKIITDDLNRLLISEKIQDKAQTELNRGQREYYLREQIKQIQEELGETDEMTEDLNSLKVNLANAKLPEHAKKEAEKQFARLEKLSNESSEYTLLRNYLEWISELPWSIRTKYTINLKKAKEILDEDHFGLSKAKQRILDYLSVRKLNPNIKGPILCFVGPPGTGKTSLGYSIAKALKRKFYKMSLGGVRDEAEIIGHRRTYVGALPGRIIQGLKAAGSSNCVFILDELDKLGSDFRGDPASALLEVLDPAQNKEFRDHYLNLSFDLSEVLFIATANTVDTIPEALLDRLELIYISGYTTEEKKKIVKEFIFKKQLQENGLGKFDVNLQEKAVEYIIERYTAEAGVRSLDREIATLCRKIARKYTEDNVLIKKVSIKNVAELLGPTKYDPEVKDLRELVGIARGLAWTMNGGEIMMVEASIAKGSGSLSLTGQLGNVMQESAQAALFYARANAKALGLNPNFHEKFDMHIHVPGGATPKDGPSAGITIATALVSALSGKKISSKVAMTGEITLRGNVLPVGGLKEKALAALRYGIKQVIIPSENIKDIEEIPKAQREAIDFKPVIHISEVLKIALLKK
jgi:ATP-dependent Lon protease